MSIDPSIGRRRLVRALTVSLAISVAAAVVILCFRTPKVPADNALRELRKGDLTLRDGRLFAAGEGQPFTGRLYGNFSPGVRKLEIEIRDGKAHGRSRGYHENGQLEVEEFFIGGTAHGLRTRWDAEGRKKSVATIAHGKIDGVYTEWHDNGTRAAEMTFAAGQPEGLARAWHPSGAPKSLVQFHHGKQVSRQFYDDPAALAEHHAPQDTVESPMK